ncbi:glycosyltransferase family 8 protein [Halomonas halmophila]|uniref:General stress protein A n=1 Tax=Halomonas halmophila TaxID=252 RepID=A0A4Y4F6A5_9GAMM|nr:glycosyltransferase family 8 protein [Halomonas halmophila]GED22641.1 general stress protein A [Halomonas halmophila]
MDIVLCADETYIDKAATVMASVLCHASRSEEITFHLLGHDISTASRAKLEAWFDKLPARLRFTETQHQTTAQWQALSLGRFGPAAMLRLSMERWLPEDVKRVLYLDCDVLVLDDVARLAGIEMHGYAVAAAMNLQNVPQDRLGIPYTKYFNSGILLVDLDRWKSRGVMASIEQRLNSQSEATWQYPDQDALNLVFTDWLRLPLRWNMQPYTYPAVEKKATHYVEWRHELLEAASNPAVVHFMGPIKPWNVDSRHPLTSLFRKYMYLTPWTPILEVGQLSPFKRLRRRLLQAPKSWRRRRRLRQSPSLTLPVASREAR